MKIYTEIVWDMNTCEIISEDSFEYSGPLALCDFGGAPSSSNAADAGKEAASNALLMYGMARQDLAPYREAGEKTLPYYGGILGIPGYEQVDPTNALRSTPGYDWTLGQGVEAIDRSAAARGMMGSGAVAKGLTKYGQGLADQTYNNYMNRLYDVIKGGQNAAVQTGQFGMQEANTAGNALVQGGIAQDQADRYAYESGNQGWNSLAGGLGLLGGALLSPMPAAGLAGTVGGGLYNALRG